MTKPADTKHGNKVAGPRRRVPQSTECRDSRAQQRCCIGRRQVIRNRHEPTRLCDHYFGVSAILMNAGIFLVPTVHEIAIAAELAIAAKAPEEPDAHALPNRPALDTGTKRV